MELLEVDESLGGTLGDVRGGCGKTRRRSRGPDQHRCGGAWRALRTSH